MNPPRSEGRFGPEPGEWHPPIPAGILLDTSIVSYLDTYGEQVWDNVPADPGLADQQVRQLDALRILTALADRAHLAFAVTPEVIRQAARRPGGRRYAEQILIHWREARFDWGIEERRATPMTLVAELPPKDQLVLAEAYRSGCEAVLTNDLAWTKQSHRRRIAALGMEAHTPETLIEQLRPWLALWL